MRKLRDPCGAIGVSLVTSGRMRLLVVRAREVLSNASVQLTPDEADSLAAELMRLAREARDGK
jgi:hypothetical protein